MEANARAHALFLPCHNQNLSRFRPLAVMSAGANFDRDKPFGESGMGIKVSRKRALVFASGLAALAVGFIGSSTPLKACDSQNCDTRLVVAQAQPATTQAAKPTAAGAPVSLKRFTKAKSRSARNSRRNAAAQKASAHAEAARRAKENADNKKDAAEIAAEAKKIAPTVANANAQLVDGVANTDEPFNASAANATAPAIEASAPQSEAVQLVEAEELNDVDKAAWEANPQSRSTNKALMESRAEMREDDSRWAQTSTIGKIFVAFGALLTIGSAIRMFLA
jgi:hypothetical protein